MRRQHQVAYPCVQGVHRDVRLTINFARLIRRPYDQQLATLQLLIFDSRYRCADNFCDPHNQLFIVPSLKKNTISIEVLSEAS
jgi:hypothetical protein